MPLFDDSDMQGAATGAAMGTAIAPGWGTAIGAGAGILGSKLGLFGSKNKPWYDEEFFSQRAGEISNFERQLAGARQSYLNSVGNFYNNALTRYAKNAPAVMAAHGFTTDSGAFAAELARKTADAQAALTPLASEWERQDLGAVNNARAGLFGQRLAAKMGQSNLGYQASQDNWASIGGLAGRLAMGYAQNRMSQGPWRTTATDYSIPMTSYDYSGVDSGAWRGIPWRD